MCRALAFVLLLNFSIVCFAQNPATAPAPATTTTVPTTLPANSLHDNDFVAICGDSITEQKLYSLYIQDYLTMCRPRTNLHAMQFGWGGETAKGFLGRMSNVLRFPVTVATTCYGMNDGGYAALTPERAQQYRDSTKAIVDLFKKTGVRFIVVGSPGVVDSKTFRAGNPDEDKIYNKTLADLRDIAKQVATEQGVAFADVHATMMDVMTKAKAKYGEDYPFAGPAPDGVHPGPNGHLVMAYAFLKALGCDGNIGTISVDLAGNKADATAGHMVLSASAGAVEIESTRYPFCFTVGDPKSPDNTAGILEFLPFNQDLNRYQLIVTNPGAAKTLKVTWGGKSKDYPIAELAKGINLAAEFLENPFCEPFKKAEQAARDQQGYETFLIKNLLHNMPDYAKQLPEQKEAIDKVMQAGIDKAKAMNDASIAAIVPVKHTIKIEKVN